MAFFKSSFSRPHQFINDWIEFLSTNELAAGVFDEFQPDDFLGWDATLVPAVLSNFAHSPNASPTENDALLNAILSNQQSNFVSSVLNSGTAVLNNALTGILSNDPTDLLLNCMATNNPVGLNSVYVSLGGSPTPPPTNASRIAYIRSFPPPTIAAQISAIESISNLQNYFSSCLNSTMIYNSWNSAQPNISFTDLFDAWSGLGDTSLILDVLQNHYSNDAHLRILLKEVRTLQQLYQLASSSNYSNFVSNSINATSYQDLSFVMYQSSALTFSSYLKQVRTHFGTTNYSSMMADIGEWLKFGKDILLQEQHIYGSTRLGMYQSNQLLVKYKYKYSDTLQIYLDSVKFDRDTNRAMRNLSHKQYELTNHLGNVLSTVLDRKTPITSAGGSGGSGGSTTITHFEGDVVFASDYYPFGSPLTWTTTDSSGGRLYSGGGYRYGFNGMEKDDEIKESGNSNTTEFRQYDPRLGRWLSLDPKVTAWESPYVSMGNNPILNNDVFGDSIPVKFSTLWANYPKTGTSEQIYNNVGGKVADLFNENKDKGNSNRYINTCALRMSVALNKSNEDLDVDVKNSKGQKMYTAKGSDDKDYAFRKNDVKDYLKGKYGAADISTKSTDKDFQDKIQEIQGKQGIIVFDITGWSNATGHVTLYDGSGNCGHDCYFQDVLDAENVQRMTWNTNHPNEKQLPMVELKGVSIWIAK